MSKDIQAITVVGGQKVTLEGINRKGKVRQHFICNEVSENSCEISAGRGMQIIASSKKQLKLNMLMQNGKKLYLHYNHSK